ncbi:MAG: radical SAM protein [Planctomycetota bacterium]
MDRIVFLKPYRPEKLFVTTPPLGILAVAAYVRREAARRHEKVELEILDLNPRRLLPEQVIPRLRQNPATLFGISALSCEAGACRLLSQTLKRHFPATPIVLGGPFPSHDSDQALRDENIDYIVRGEGEETFDELVRVLREGGDPSTVLGIGYRRNGELHQTADRPFIPDLNRLPLPAYDLLDLEPYFDAPRHSRLIAHREYMTVVSSRGCPYRCIYCHVTMGKKTRFLSAERVVDEIEVLVKQFGVREIQWADDIWNLDRRRSKRICDLIVERGLDIKMAFPNGVRGDIFDDELLDKMRAAGTYMITFAPESGSERVQKFIQKNAKLPVLEQVIAKAARRGIFTHGFFMIGFPTETEEEMRATFRFALRSKLNTATFFIVNAHPGTRLHELATEMGLRVDFRSSALNYMNPNFQLSNVPTAKVRRLLRLTYLRFFLSPSRLWRLVCMMPHKRQLLDFARELVHRLWNDLARRRPDIYLAEGVPPFEPREVEPVTPYNRT